MEETFMSRDYILIVIEWIVMLCLLVKFIPKNKIREALVSISFNQLITWPMGLIVVALGLIEYPVRLFSHTSKTCFSFEYFSLPSICAIFNVNYPEKKGPFGQFMYYFYYCTAITIFEVFTEKYTSRLKYIHWSWYITWITIFISLYITRKLYTWFFKLK